MRQQGMFTFSETRSSTFHLNIFNCLFFIIWKVLFAKAHGLGPHDELMYLSYKHNFICINAGLPSQPLPFCWDRSSLDISCVLKSPLSRRPSNAAGDMPLVVDDSGDLLGFKK